MVLHANGANGVDSVEFRFMADRNGTVATALMNTDRAAADYHSANFFMAALMNDGSVRAWGRALTGQQGTGNTGDISRTFPARRSEEHTSELQSLMRLSYAVFSMNKT